MKKTVSLLSRISALLFLALFLTGCGASPISQDENTLTFLIQTHDAETTYTKRIIKLFEEKTGNHIKILSFDEAEFEQKALELFEKGNVPDIFVHFNNSDLTKYNVSENFYYLNEEAWIDEMTDGAKAYSMDSDGNIIGLPFWESSVSGCYYNRAIFDELGLKPASTQEEFDALCEALKTVGYTPMYWGGDGCHWPFQFGLDPIFADDPELLEKLNRNEIAYADIPAVRDMVEWLYAAKQKGWFNADYATANWDDLAIAVGNGDVATVFIWDTWFSMNLKEGSKYSIEDFELMPVFMNTTEMGTYEGGNLAMFMANKNSKKLELALEFLSFCATPENYNAAFDGIATVSCFKNQTTNIQSKMVTNAMTSILANERVSTAWPKIIGYNQNDVGNAILKLFQEEVDVDGCIELMDESRIAVLKKMQPSSS